MEEIYRVEIDKVRKEAKEISDLVDAGITGNLKKNYSKFRKAFPVLYDNLINKKMSIEEINALLDTFSIAQEQFIKNSGH